MLLRCSIRICIAILAVLVSGGAASADSISHTYSPISTTNNDRWSASGLPNNVQIGMAQLRVTTSSVDGLATGGNGMVDFTFANLPYFQASGFFGGTSVKPFASVITDIYFDDGTGTGTPRVLSSYLSMPTKDATAVDVYDESDGYGSNFSGVDFTWGAARPDDLNGRRNLDPVFVTTDTLLGEAVKPQSKNGINPGESLTLRFALQSGNDYWDVFDAISNGRLRLGMKVQGFSDCGSEAFAVVPLPPAAFAGLALAGLAITMRQARKTRLV
jgi:hypothetical protein